MDAALDGGAVLKIVFQLPLVEDALLLRHDVVVPDDACVGADGERFGQVCLREDEGLDMVGVGQGGAALQLAVVVVCVHVAHLRAVVYRHLRAGQGRGAAHGFPEDVVEGVGGSGFQQDGRIEASHGGVVGVHLGHGGRGRRVLDGEDERGLAAVAGVLGGDAVAARRSDDGGGEQGRRGRGGVDGLAAVVDVVDLPSDQVVGRVGIGGEGGGVGEADLPVAEDGEAGTDNDGEAFGTELATGEEVALVSDGDGVSAGSGELIGHLVGLVHRGGVDSGGGRYVPHVARRTVEGDAVHHGLAHAGLGLPAYGHAVLYDGDADAEAALAGPSAAQGAVETDGAVAVERAVPGDGDVGGALPVDDVAALDAPEVLAADGG